MGWVAHVIIESAQVLLVLTLGLWDFGLWDFGLGLDNITRVYRVIELFIT